MENHTTDIGALAQDLETFTRTTRSMEEAYRRLEERVDQLDRELADKNRQLAFTSDYLSNLLESMNDGVIAVDPQGIITRFNRAARVILGYRADEVIGHSFTSVFDRDFAAPRNHEAVKLRAKSGRTVPVSERDSPISDQTNRRLGWVKTFQDLSELTALREQVRQMDRLAAIGEMAATVAHEIRNPLGGIRGFAAFLAQDVPPEDPKRRLIDKITEGAQSLDKVVNELLEYTRPVELNLRPTSCLGMAQAALSYVKSDPERITISTEVDPTLKALADPDQIRQVFLNILLNAVQSIDEEGHITVTSSADDSYITFVFRDTGCGMAPEQLGKIFSPFFTTKEKGTGLGLAVCQKIIEGHAGEIRAESEPGKGTAITVRLPRTE